MNTLFPTQEIGSLPKPPWVVKALRGQPLREAERQDLLAWSERVGLMEEGRAYLERLDRGEHTRDTIRDFAALFNLRFLETAGLDVVYDGEARRIEMYEYPVRHSDGFTFLGHVRSFDNKYYRKAAATGPVRARDAYHVQEFRYNLQHARRPLKVPVTGAYTLADWSFNEYYEARLRSRYPRLMERKYRAKEDLTYAIAEEIILPNLEALVEAGARWIQIDEPAATTHPEEISIVVESFNRSVQGLREKGVKLSIHICYSDYLLLYPHILEMDVDHLALEFANKDNFEILGEFYARGERREIGLGVVDVHRNRVETPEEIQGRVERAVEAYHGMAEKLWLNPDCGLRTRSLHVAYEKLRAITTAARNLRRQAS